LSPLEKVIYKKMFSNDKYDYGFAANLLFGDSEDVGIKGSAYDRFYGIGVRPVANP